jgi:hypothetical protein
MATEKIEKKKESTSVSEPTKAKGNMLTFTEVKGMKLQDVEALIKTHGVVFIVSGGLYPLKLTLASIA